MATHRYDPYLWVHLAGIATVPLWLAICGLGLAVGSPRWPALELVLLGGVGVLPVLGMQLGRPFYIFSLLLLTLKPTALSEDQRRLLSLFQRWWVRSLAVVAPVPLVWLLWEIYPRAVVASDITPFAPWGRLGGLAIAAGSFAMANLFLQVPASVLAVMATSDKRFKRTVPYPLDQINARFTQAGLPLKRILPEVLPPAVAVRGGQAAEPEAVVPEAAIPEPIEPQELEAASLATEVSLNPAAKVDEAQVWADALRPQAEPSRPEVSITEDALGEADTSVEALDSSLETVSDQGHSDGDSPSGDALPNKGQGDPGNAAKTVEVLIETEADLEPETKADLEPETEDAAIQTEADHGPWDHAHGDWDQSTHDWDQDRDWETPVDSPKDHTIDVAVVRISDPSGLSG